MYLEARICTRGGGSTLQNSNQPNPKRRSLEPPTTGWGKLFRDPQAGRLSFFERDALEARYSSLLEERLSFGSQVGPKRALQQPVHRWFFYKEAFSNTLVEEILNHWALEPGVFLDPFAGVGTAPFVAAQLGWEAYGVEFLPVSAFVAQAKASAHLAGAQRLAEAAEKVLNHDLPPDNKYPNFRIAGRAFDAEVRDQLLILDQAIMLLPISVERDLLKVALLSIVEEVSHTTKDGTSLRLSPPERRRGRYGLRRTAEDVRIMFDQKVRDIIEDLPKSGIRGLATILLGDARQLASLLPGGSVSASVTSPPYPNRYDYSANYQLELGFGFVRDREELRSLRKEQLRSHVECPWPLERTVELPALEEILRCLLFKGMSTTRVFRMLAGYFEDMALVIRGMARVMRPGAHWALVVGNVQFSGEIVPTDLLLAELARQEGFEVDAVWVARYKNRNVQQLIQYGNHKSRESILMLRRT